MSQVQQANQYGAKEAWDRATEYRQKSQAAQQAVLDAQQRMANNAAQPQSSKSKWAEMIRQLVTGVAIPAATGLLGGPGGRAASVDLVKQATDYTQQLRANHIAQQKADNEAMKNINDMVEKTGTSYITEATNRGKEQELADKNAATANYQAGQLKYKNDQLESLINQRAAVAAHWFSRANLDDVNAQLMPEYKQSIERFHNAMTDRGLAEVDRIRLGNAEIHSTAVASNGEKLARAALDNVRAQYQGGLMQSQTNLANAAAGNLSSHAPLNDALISQAHQTAMHSLASSQKMQWEMFNTMHLAVPATAEELADLSNSQAVETQKLEDTFRAERQQPQQSEGLSAGPAEVLPTKPTNPLDIPPGEGVEPPPKLPRGFLLDQPGAKTDWTTPRDIPKKGATSTQGKPIKKDTQPQAQPQAKLGDAMNAINTRPGVPASLKAITMKLLRSDPSPENIAKIMKKYGTAQ